MIQIIEINVASLSAYCVRACKTKHFTEREFSGIFSFAGGRGNFAFSKREFPVALTAIGKRSNNWLNRHVLIKRLLKTGKDDEKDDVDKQEIFHR